MLKAQPYIDFKVEAESEVTSHSTSSYGPVKGRYFPQQGVVHLQGNFVLSTSTLAFNAVVAKIPLFTEYQGVQYSQEPVPAPLDNLIFGQGGYGNPSLRVLKNRQIQYRAGTLDGYLSLAGITYFAETFPVLTEQEAAQYLDQRYGGEDTFANSFGYSEGGFIQVVHSAGDPEGYSTPLGKYLVNPFTRETIAVQDF